MFEYIFTTEYSFYEANNIDDVINICKKIVKDFEEMKNDGIVFESLGNACYRAITDNPMLANKYKMNKIEEELK